MNPPAAQALARHPDLDDAFVLRRVESERFVHVGGSGRGEGWAGQTELLLSDNPAARQAYDENRLVEVTGTAARHVFGPYWAKWAVFVPLNHDLMVVFGNPSVPGTRPSDETLRRRATALTAEIQHVSPAKRLADELEVLHAIQGLMACDPTDPQAALQHIVDCATEALSCDYGIAWLRDAAVVAMSGRHWQPAGPVSDVVAMLRDDWQNDTAPLCVQNSIELPLPAPLDPAAGVLSYYRVALGKEGVLLIVHTARDARGFSELCRTLGTRLAESAELLLRTATQRQHLSSELARVTVEARHDPLTGLANRLGWQERIAALTQTQLDVGTGLIFIDLDNLKQINDQHGHETGDRVLQALARILQAHVRPDDFVARLGGDEFVVLLPNAEHSTCAEVLARLQGAVDAHPGVAGTAFGFSHGVAVHAPDEDIHDALRRADQALLGQKRAKRL